ncbi:hypothetical protein ASG29_11490 [Sphingomonas sp. Leaf412]|uniref:hypothetical protein n=1 Tax=Sphingomonas sp. Leaf412 TaxID=1736370 RepID=UPI0006FE0AC9|nr:hypothetical protein [Sphingomonas sp. Leaf412]KQT32404.1 hypothetical protein ASG29_11490 [Sphingomonas sp. Leaf412]
MPGHPSRTVFLATALVAMAACDATARTDDRGSRLPAPPGTIAETRDPAAAALAAVVRRRIGGRTISTARYFRMQPAIAWNAVSTFVAGKRGTDGRPPKPRFVDGGLDLIDVYPAAAGRPAFAVAMAHDAAADGTKLVGYFDLAD